MKREKTTFERIRDNKYFLFVLMFCLIFVRWCRFGFEYYPQLDDYIQYHNYSQGGTPISTIVNLGLLAARPLAGIADILIWSNFFGNMIIAVILISAMYSATACILYSVFSRRFGTGRGFLVLMTLLPLAIEGTYWISASSRIVTGLLFSSIALYYFDKWCETGTKRSLIIFVVSQLISFGFYEQVIVFSAVSVLLLAVILIKIGGGRIWWGLLTLLNSVIYVIFTSIFSNSAVYSGRLGMLNPFTSFYWQTMFPYIRRQITEAFIKAGFYILTKGTYRSFGMLRSQSGLLYLIIVITLCVVLFAINLRGRQTDNIKKNEKSTKRYSVAFIYGFLLALAPIAIFFAIESAWFSLRCTVIPLCGLALMGETVLRFLSEKSRYNRTIYASIISAMALIFCISSVSEIYDYKLTTEIDQSFVSKLAKQLEEDDRLRRGISIAVLNVWPSYLLDQNYFFHEHIHGVTESDWALTGALEWYIGSDRPDVTPMREDVADNATLAKFDAVYRVKGAEFIKVR